MRHYPKFRYFAILLPAFILIVFLHYLSIQLEEETIREAMHMQTLLKHLNSIILETLWAFGISFFAGMKMDGSNGGRLGCNA